MKCFSTFALYAAISYSSSTSSYSSSFSSTTSYSSSFSSTFIYLLLDIDLVLFHPL